MGGIVEHRVQFLTANGLFGGDPEMKIDASAEPVEYWIEVPDGRNWLRIERMLWTISDTGGFSGDGFGAGVALPVGMDLNRTRNGVETSLCGGLPIKTNTDVRRLMHDANLGDFGAGAKSIHGRFSFNRIGGPIELRGPDRLRIILNDSFLDIDSMMILAEGTIG